MRKALIVGIDYYEAQTRLARCVEDAIAVKTTLAVHANGDANFPEPKLMTATGPDDPINRADLRDAVEELFSDKTEIALFYYAGHGHGDSTGGFLCTSESRGHDGLALSDVLTFAQGSKATNKVIILDCCHSGVAGQKPLSSDGATELHEGITILTASTKDQAALENENGGLFTQLLVDALNGAAANLLGDVTPGSIYAHIDRSLGTWGQRPVFKTNVSRFVSLRRATPPIDPAELRQLAQHFPIPGYEFPLNPSYERMRSSDEMKDPTIPAPDPLKCEIFSVLQNYVRVNLLRPVDAPHMWHAAMGSKSCKLTVSGEYYRNLVARKLI